jgi:hypothetical protein
MIESGDTFDTINSNYGTLQDIETSIRSALISNNNERVPDNRIKYLLLMIIFVFICGCIILPIIYVLS